MAISSQHKGKRGELFVFSELLRNGAVLYTPVVDTGVDAVVFGANGTYIELQVKATQAPDQDRYFNFDDWWDPQPGRVFICVSLKDDPPSVWVLPWNVFKKYALLSGGNWRLPLPQKMQADPSGKTREELLEPYCASKHPDAWRPLLPP
jgi:hypothetical protein